MVRQVHSYQKLKMFTTCMGFFLYSFLPTWVMSGFRLPSSYFYASYFFFIRNPPQTATSFFKVAASQPVTFGWNMTSVLATPTHLMVSAICTNGNTYPVGPTDGIIPGTATQVA